MTTDTDILIVGSGFAGLGMAVRLKQASMHDFVVLERGDDVGGTWHFNTYPGCACDVPSHLYSLSFAPNPEWSQTYSPQAEIGAYLKGVADRFGIREHLRLEHTVSGAEWDEAAGRWTVETDRGTFTARVLIGGMGGLTEPSIPDVPGLDEFTGAMFHSARWDHDYDFTGKRVAAIGTGASAIQFVPAIAKQVDQLHVVQRTPPWIMPHSNRPVTDRERRLYRRLPIAQKLVRGMVWSMRETNVLGFTKNPRFMAVADKISKAHMRKQISDPELLEKVMPNYTIGCKRILPSNRWYPALGRENVELLTGGLKEVRGNTIVAGDGTEREVDAIVWGTGFQVTDLPFAEVVRGRGGRSLADVWGGSMKALRGTSVPGFPNFFMLAGPNTGLGHSSMVYMIETNIAHVLGALKAMRGAGATTVEPSQEAFDAYVAEIDAKMKTTVWSTGCKSWYRDSTGRISTLWPDWTWRFRRDSRDFDPAEYRLSTTSAPARETVLA
jgi:cation diffusion facilitator CzcD-associated flavoprotein CzcO